MCSKVHTKSTAGSASIAQLFAEFALSLTAMTGPLEKTSARINQKHNIQRSRGIMGIQEITGKTVQFAIETAESTKNFVLWGARSVAALIPPGAAKVKEIAAKTWQLFESLIKTGPVGIFALSAVLFTAGIAAFKLADRKAYEDETVAKALWKSAGIAAFIAATVFTSVGMAASLSA